MPSEYAERLYEIEELAPNKIRPIGIAAHPSDPSLAFQSAKLEVMETLMLQRIKQNGRAEGFRILSTQPITLSVQALKGLGFFAVLRTNYLGKPLLSYSARPTLLATLQKVWEESRNPHFHRTSLEDMKTFSKSTMLFSDEELCRLQFTHSPRSIDGPDLSQIEFIQTNYRSHHIFYAVPRLE